MRPISGHLSGAEAASKATALPMTKIPVVVTGSDLVPVLTCRMFIFLTPFIEQEISFSTYYKQIFLTIFLSDA